MHNHYKTEQILQIILYNNNNNNNNNYCYLMVKHPQSIYCSIAYV